MEWDIVCVAMVQQSLLNMKCFWNGLNNPFSLASVKHLCTGHSFTEHWLDLKGNIWITGIILHTAEGMQEIK